MGMMVIVFIVGAVAGHYILPMITEKFGGGLGSQAAYTRALRARRWYGYKWAAQHNEILAC